MPHPGSRMREPSSRVCEPQDGSLREGVGLLAANWSGRQKKSAFRKPALCCGGGNMCRADRASTDHFIAGSVSMAGLGGLMRVLFFSTTLVYVVIAAPLRACGLRKARVGTGVR